MKTKPESEFVMVRPKRDDSPTINVSIYRNNEKLNLTDFRYMRIQENGLEEWVHKDDYDFYYDHYHKFDSLKE